MCRFDRDSWARLYWYRMEMSELYNGGWSDWVPIDVIAASEYEATQAVDGQSDTPVRVRKVVKKGSCQEYYDWLEEEIEKKERGV